MSKQISRLLCSILGAAATAAIAWRSAQAQTPFIGSLTQNEVGSTVPSNGDLNPYGVAVIPATIGNLQQGNILVSNFNNGPANLQGLGTTIVELTPSGSLTTFAQIDPKSLPGNCPGGVGLTTALTVLSRGWVIVGSLPTSDGTSATARDGCLIVLDSAGKPVKTIAGGRIRGPWDMVALDQGASVTLFVTNVLNGDVTHGTPHVVNKGTVVRIDLDVPMPGGHQHPNVDRMTMIGSGFSEKADPTALIIGPTGLGLGSNGTLFVADTLNSRITAIPDALRRNDSAETGNEVTTGGSLNGPLGMAIAPNGDILTVNGGDGLIVETTPGGDQVATQTITPNGAGALFGLAITPSNKGVYFVDDGANTLNVLQ